MSVADLDCLDSGQMNRGRSSTQREFPMDTRPASHPPADVLLALGSGKLDDATAEAIFFHVEVCPKCLEAVGRLTGDGVLDKLRAARGNSGTPASSMAI